MTGTPGAAFLAKQGIGNVQQQLQLHWFGIRLKSPCLRGAQALQDSTPPETAISEEASK